MKISSLIRKFFNLLLLKKDSSFHHTTTYYAQSLPASIRRVLFYFPNPELMHLGDHLFFEPALAYLSHHSIEVSIIPTPAMQSYFSQLGYTTTWIEADIIVSRYEFYHELTSYDIPKVFFNTSYSPHQQFLCDDLTQQLASLCSLPCPSFLIRPQSPPSILSFPWLHKHPLLIVSNSIDSSRFRLRSHDFKLIDQKAYELKKQYNLCVIHVGSDSDKKNFPPLSCSDYDLRGKTTVNDIFALCALPQTWGGVTFDSFILHLLAMNDKHLFVRCRGRFLKKNAHYIQTYVSPPFYTTHSPQFLV